MYGGWFRVQRLGGTGRSQIKDQTGMIVENLPRKQPRNSSRFGGLRLAKRS